MTTTATRFVRLLALVLLAVCPARETFAQLNENCTISVLNRNVRVRPDGSWVLPNVPANFGFVRARVTCIVEGRTISGESDPFLIPANGVVNQRSCFAGLDRFMRAVATIGGTNGLVHILRGRRSRLGARRGREFRSNTPKQILGAG